MLYIIVFRPRLHVVYGLYTLCVIPSAVGRDYKYVCVCMCVCVCVCVCVWAGWGVVGETLYTTLTSYVILR